MGCHFIGKWVAIRHQSANKRQQHGMLQSGTATSTLCSYSVALCRWQRVFIKCGSIFKSCIITFSDSSTVLSKNNLFISRVLLHSQPFTVTGVTANICAKLKLRGKKNTNICCCVPTIQTLLICLHNHTSMLDFYHMQKHCKHLCPFF